MPLTGEYEPSSSDWAREQAEQYEATGGAESNTLRGKPIVATVCHCRFCQRRLASAFAMIATFPEQAVELTQGELAACEHRSDESGRWLRMHFCPKCGTTVYHVTEFRPGARSVALPNRRPLT